MAPKPKRPRITGITLHVLMPDGNTRIHTLDPNQADALVWSDRAVDVLGMFYGPKGPAKGKRLSHEHITKHFGEAAKKALFKPGQDEVDVTPEMIRTLWDTPKDEGHTPGYLAKATSNIING